MGRAKQINLWFRDKHYQYLKNVKGLDASDMVAKAVNLAIEVAARPLRLLAPLGAGLVCAAQPLAVLAAALEHRAAANVPLVAPLCTLRGMATESARAPAVLALAKALLA